MESFQKKKTMATAPVFFTAISTILGAILFLRFGYAVGTLGFVGVIGIIIVGHLVTIPTSLAISEIATNQRVEGGGEYFIISRSFGLNIGATIGIALYLSQAISVAFYIIAFTETFEPLFNFFHEKTGGILPRQVISVPVVIGLAYLILKKGAGIGVKTLYIVVTILFLSLLFFFLGETEYSQTAEISFFNLNTNNINGNFFLIFAIVFPAFTGMTAGVGLSGDLKNPGRSIPFGTIAATILGMVLYVFIAWKLYISFPLDYLAPLDDPATPNINEAFQNQLAMKDVALFGAIVIPLGLAASTISSAIGSILVAPRTLQALGIDRSLPARKFNLLMARGRGTTNEPFNSTVITSVIALFFVLLGDVNIVARIISMFFMVTYGSICLISFLHHFGADPSYRPVFRSRWYISLLGFVMCVYLMIQMDAMFALLAFTIITLIYLSVGYAHKDRGGMQAIFQNSFFQLSRKIQVYIQKSKKSSQERKWRPSVVCVSENSFEREKPLKVLNWICNKYGFGTYIHLIDGYFNEETNKKAHVHLKKLIDLTDEKSNVYLDTLISPSYTSAIAQIVQLPGISGMENNMVLFEYDKYVPAELNRIVDKIPIAKAAGHDICVLGSSKKNINFRQGIHVWIRSADFENSSLMILLSYIMLGHPDWKKGKIKIFEIEEGEDLKQAKKNLMEMINIGRIPIPPENIEIISCKDRITEKALINERSQDAGLTLIGFMEENLRNFTELFTGYDKIGDILFVNAFKHREI